MSAPEREVEKPLPVREVVGSVPSAGAVSMRALLASCAAATAVSTPPDAGQVQAGGEERVVERRDAA
ncbi:hypothetical protein [Streptomyces sp. NPDC051561]|uniref:hypothetical protein n=1 Tax=Streptomyces sp. NPDC051561 TaxID=3365658 RepID=UPI0037BC080F